MDVIIFLLILPLVSADIRPLSELTQVYEKLGDLNLGIVLPVHRYDNTQMCSTTIRELGSFQRIEAIEFAIKDINSRQDILPNTTLGYILMDDCSKDTTALARTLHFIQNTSTTSNPNSVKSYNVFGVIGTESSRNSVQMADMLSIFQVPILSYLSTSPILSEKNAYPYFSRIVPSDVLQAKVIVDVLNHFGWSYISIVYAEGSYGTLGYQAVKTRIEESGSCLAVTRELRQSFTASDYDAVVFALLRIPRATVVVIFAPLYQTTSVLQAVERNNAIGKFTWIGSDAWGRNIQDYKGIEEPALGALTVKFYSPPVDKFDDFFKYRTVDNSAGNPWIKSFISAHFKCSFNASGSESACNNSMNFVPGYKPEVTVSLAMDAVYAYAYALHAILSSCPEALTSPTTCFTGQDMLEMLRNVSFQGEHGKVLFNEFGDGIAVYELQNLQYTNGEYSLESVALWDSELRNFTVFKPDAIMWNPLLTSGIETNPKSTCSDSCEDGFQAVVTQPHCCWYCQKCRGNERTIIRDGLQKCEICPKVGNFTWPDDETKTHCIDINPTIVTVKDFTGVLIISLGILVVVLAIGTTVMYILNNKQKLIKASSRELSYLILGGVFLSSIFVSFFIVSPTDFTCAMTDLGFHLSFTFSYGPLLVKTNRIYRIFTSGKTSNKRPPFIDSKYQIMFAVVTILIQIVIIMAFVLSDPPRAVTQMPSFSERYVEITCKIPEIGFLVSLVYNMMLVIFCTFHAMQTRKLPDNFNESKYISFCVYTTIVLWLAFIPTYFTTTRTNYKAMFLSLAMLANSLVTLCFLFLPKLYALYLVASDKQNIAQGTSIGRVHAIGMSKSNVVSTSSKVGPM